MIRNILLILIGFISGMFIDALLFQLPGLHECYETNSEIMDVVDYYSVMLTRSLNTCEDIINDNITLTKQYKEAAIRNAELIEQCRIRGINIRNDE
jgi:hypothetical protein